MTVKNKIDEMLHVPESGTYEVDATVRETPVGESIVSFTQEFPDEIREEAISQAGDELEDASVSQSVTIVVDVDGMDFEIHE